MDTIFYAPVKGSRRSNVVEKAVTKLREKSIASLKSRDDRQLALARIQNGADPRYRNTPWD